MKPGKIINSETEPWRGLRREAKELLENNKDSIGDCVKDHLQNIVMDAITNTKENRQEDLKQYTEYVQDKHKLKLKGV